MVKGQDERGTLTLDVLVSLAILAIAAFAARSIMTPTSSGLGISNAGIVLGYVSTLHSRATTQNQSQSLVVTPNANNTTTLSLVTGHDPTAAASESRSVPGLVTSSVQATKYDQYMISASADGSITVGLAAVIKIAVAPPACPANPTMTFSGLAYAIDCSSGRLIAPTTLNQFAHTGR